MQKLKKLKAFLYKHTYLKICPTFKRKCTLANYAKYRRSEVELRGGLLIYGDPGSKEWGTTGRNGSGGKRKEQQRGRKRYTKIL